MNTKTVQYETGTKGYTAIVKDFKELFHWDSFLEATDGKTASTTFKMTSEGDSEVGLIIGEPSSTSGYSTVVAYVNNGSSTYNSGSTQSFRNSAYACGDGFFIICGGGSSFPSSDSSSSKNSTVGVVRSRSMLTGETEYCSFAVNSGSYCFYSRSTMSDGTRNSTLYTNASVGAAISLHDPDSLLVADSILLLTAIPDTLTACLSKVMFNGTPYMRLGRLLIPIE